eukprot:scaffold182184_cov28-Tisochrysis_lutea.AAC.1
MHKCKEGGCVRRVPSQPLDRTSDVRLTLRLEPGVGGGSVRLEAKIFHTPAAIKDTIRRHQQHKLFITSSLPLLSTREGGDGSEGCSHTSHFPENYHFPSWCQSHGCMGAIRIRATVFKPMRKIRRPPHTPRENLEGRVPSGRPRPGDRLEEVRPNDRQS